jgi:outer membrane receptor protein involved in Fe transport
VAVYIDELPISANGNSTILDPNLYDVERVEFLRGPQGTLFGSNSIAGAMRILTKSPELDEFGSSAWVDIGMTDPDALRQRYNGMVNVPLVEDKLALRMVGFYRNEEGYVDNIGTGIENSNTLVDWGGRAILLWKPVEKLSLRFMYLTEDSAPEDSSLVSPALGERERLSDRPDRFQAYLDSFNFALDYEFSGASLTSSSTYSTYDQEFVVDLAGTFAQAFPFALDAYAYDETFVQELRLVSESNGKFEWVLGGYYNYKRRDVDYNYRSTQEYLDAQGITGLPDEYYSRSTSYFKTHELAGFGTLTYYFNDNFWMTGGLRYTTSDVQGFTEPGGYTSNYLTYALFGLTGPLAVTPVAAATGLKGEESGPSYKISASYKPSDTLTSYVTVSTGFRTPVVNARAGQASTLDPNDLIIPDGADSDEVENYEIGIKGNWFDHKLTGNFAAYYIDWSDIQVQANRVSDTVQFATNIGQARSTGFEFEMSASPTPSLTLGLLGSWNHSEVTELTAEEAAISGAVEGAQLAFPEFQGAAYLKYDFGLGKYDGFLTTDFQYVGGYPNQFPYAPGQPGVPVATYDETESYTNVNMTFGATLSEKTSLTAYVENVFNEDAYIYVHPEAFIENRYGIQRPRTIGLRFSYIY